MPKRFLFTALCAFLLTLTLIAQAQDEPAPTQSVAEAVSTLIAQTQQTPNMTQTVQRALEEALTGTAQAATAQPATPEAPISEPLDVDTLEVVNTTEFDLLAGPMNTAAFLAPDGERFVYFGDNQLCLYLKNGNADTPERCVELVDGLRRLDAESIIWSRNSRSITFTENFFQYFVDSDIWLWDTTTNALQNLTDDGDNEIELGEETWENIDVAPTWLEDGRILFMRYSRVNGENLPTELFVIAPDGSGLEQFGTLEEATAFATFAVDAHANQLVYNYFRSDDAENGVWMSALEGSDAQQVFASENETIIYEVYRSPDGRSAMIYTPNRIGQPAPENSMMRLVDLESGEGLLIDPDRYVVAAGWSPDGSAFAYLVTDRTNEEESGLYITDTPGEAGRLVLQGLFNAPTPRLSQPLTWGANNTILFSGFPDYHVVLVELGS